MGKSYRRPYSSPTGVHSAHWDKKQAARGMRRLQNRHLKTHWGSEDFLMPHRREACHNDVCGWNRDGRQRLQKHPDHRKRLGWFVADGPSEEFEEWYQQAVAWYESLFRK